MTRGHSDRGPEHVQSRLERFPDDVENLQHSVERLVEPMDRTNRTVEELTQRMAILSDHLEAFEDSRRRLQESAGRRPGRESGKRKATDGGTTPTERSR